MVRSVDDLLRDTRRWAAGDLQGPSALSNPGRGLGPTRRSVQAQARPFAHARLRRDAELPGARRARVAGGFHDTGTVAWLTISGSGVSRTPNRASTPRSRD